MALNIKNPEVERLAAEIARITGETKTAAIHRALEERKRRLELESMAPERRERLLRFLEEEVWSRVPREKLGQRLSKREREAILGYGPDGV